MAYAVSGWESVQKRESAFDRLFLDHHAKVTAIAYRVLGDADEAEDVTQDVFYSFYRAHDPEAPYAAYWLYRAAAHTALNAVRGKRRRVRREETVERLRPAGQDPVDPQQAVEDDEQRNEVRAALSRLPRKTAAVLVLRYSGLSYAEVADALDVKVGQVGTLLRRAEAALRKELTHETPR